MLNFLTSLGQLTHLLRVVWNGSAWDHLGSMATSGPHLEHPHAPQQAGRPEKKAAPHLSRPSTVAPYSATESTQP